MSDKSRSAKDRMVLLTLVDLLLQILFVFFAIVLFVDQKRVKAEGDAEKAKYKIEADAKKLIAIDDLEMQNRKLKEAVSKFEAKLAGTGKPQCLCKAGPCDKVNPDVLPVALFLLKDDGIQLAPTIPETPYKSELLPLAGQTFSLELFYSRFRRFVEYNPECSFSARFVDETSSTNKAGYQKAYRRLEQVFSPMRLRSMVGTSNGR